MLPDNVIVPSLEQKRGVLLHITSLPSAFGIGGLGQEARDFIDYLSRNGYTYWQILPLNYPGYAYSPYNAISSFAGNPYLIDPSWLYEFSYIQMESLNNAYLDSSENVDFALVYQTKDRVFHSAFKAFRKQTHLTCLYEYLEKEADWLKPFAVFCVLRQLYPDATWQQWRQEYRHYSEQLFIEIHQKYRHELFYHVFLQYIFDIQLAEIKEYAIEKSIQIIGDLPLYVALESCDTWAHPELFELDTDGNPTRVAGVPPDAFSETGQLWGNPLYRWDMMQQDDFAWWKARLKKAFVFADKLRLDHFIGYVNYWAIDATETTALNGSWLPGPKAAFFDAMLRHFPQDSIIAEDLGILTDEINNLRDSYRFPGMIILQFCFQHDQNDILSFPADRIIYTGTHDNQTSAGWFVSNEKEHMPDNDYLRQYLLAKLFISAETKLTPQTAARHLVKLAFASPCHIAIIPLQDILALDDSARMNIPGVAEGNWNWRCLSSDIV